MFENNQAGAGGRAGAALALMTIICGAITILPASPAWPAPLGANAGYRQLNSRLQAQDLPLASAHPGVIAQDDGDEDDKDVPTSQVDKYIEVYETMQKDHNLTVEQAASKQGLTVAQFRDLEAKIEGNDTLRERVRKALRHAANPNAKESSDE